MQTVKLGFLLTIFSVFLLSMKKDKAPSGTQWMTLSMAEDSLKIAKKPVLIDLYTDWCGWCKVMDKKTYSNKNVAAYIASKFYAVKVNAESRTAFTWMGKSYNYNERYRTNDFAMFLTQGQLSYPTTVIIPTDGSEPQAIPGYLETKDFELILTYFGEGHYGKIPFQQYQQQFKSSWK